jgi:hypothetical protein
VKQQYIAASDLIPRRVYGLVCQGCDYNKNWKLGPDDWKADVVVIARQTGWVRMEVNGGMRTFCPVCAEMAKQGDALAEADAAFWLEDGAAT